MYIFEILFVTGEKRIVFGESRAQVFQKYIGALEVNRVEIV